MNRVFWILLSVEAVTLAGLLLAGWRSPSESGGREMGLMFGVVLPAVALVIAALVFANASSPIAKYCAMAVAAVPVLILAVVWSRSFSINNAVAGATVNAFDQRAMAKAIAGGNVSEVKELTGRTKLNEPGTNELTGSDSTLLALALAQEKPGTVEIVRTLLKAGANPNQASEKGWSIPLVRAIQLRNPHVLTALLDAGANPNQQNPHGDVAYFATLDNITDSNLAMLDLLLKRGNPDAVDGGHKSALMVAAIFGNWKAMDLLLQHGVRRDAKDNDGKTALDFTKDKIGELERSRQAVDSELRAMLGRVR